VGNPRATSDPDDSLSGMRLLPATGAAWEVIEQYASRGATTTRLADGSGEAHVHLLRIAAGGIIDRHEAGFGQLWIVVEGRGWVAGDDGQRRQVRAGDVAFFDRGEDHSKGSDSGMTVVMVQVYDLVPSSS